MASDVGIVWEQAMFSTTNAAHSQQSVRRRLTLFYSVALGFIAVIFLSYSGIRAFVLEPLIESHANVVLLAGDEEIDALVISNNARALLTSTEVVARAIYIPEMRRALDSLKLNHAELEAGNYLSADDLRAARPTYASSRRF